MVNELNSKNNLRSHIPNKEFALTNLSDLIKKKQNTEFLKVKRVYSWGKNLIQPQQGESLVSWFIRQAITFNITPKRLMQCEKEFWLSNENIDLSYIRGNAWFPRMDVYPVSLNLKDVLRKRGLYIRLEELQINISKWFPNYFTQKMNKKLLERYYRFNLAYCPMCWKESKFKHFKVLWRLPFILVCIEHCIELRESCPSCQMPLFSYNSIKEFQKEWFSYCQHCGKNHIDSKVDEKPELSVLQKEILEALNLHDVWSTQRGYSIFWKSYTITIEQRNCTDVGEKLELMKSFFRYDLPDQSKVVCPMCGKNSFRSFSSFIDHVWACKKFHVCSKCGKFDFNTKSTFDKHVWVCINQPTCPHCGRTSFESKSSYDDHLWTCFNNPVCSHCGKNDFNYKPTYNDHVKACMSKLFCPNCNKNGFTTYTGYRKHVVMCGKEDSCPICGHHGFSSKTSYQDHLRRCERDIKCPICEKSGFETKSSFDSHVWACEHKPACKICGKNGFKSKNGYLNHLWVCKNKPVCKYCGRSDFSTKSHYSDHIWVCKNNPNCSNCKKSVFSTKSSYLRHIKNCKRK